MRGKYSPTVSIAYNHNQEWWEKFSANPDSTVYVQYDPEGYDSYGYNTQGIDRAGNHENDYAMDTHGDENLKFNHAYEDWGFDGVKPVFVGVKPATVCAIGDKKCKPC